jgi:cytochrome c heme-lyase
MRAKPAASAAPASGEGCPMRAKKKAEPAACVSSAEDIDPSNMMPPANQEQSQYQSGDLSKEGNWVYPSEQMFFNALHRKGKGEGVQEEAMPAVIAIHNNMNENTWLEVLKWEALRKDECDAPKLLRFMGRPDELTVKAGLKYYTGLSPKPFDRHDWTVDRCGRHVRYLIDYYDVAKHRGADRVPTSLHEVDATPSIQVDVRPAIWTDAVPSTDAAVDQLRMLWRGARRAASRALDPDAPPPPSPPADAGAAKARAEADRLARATPASARAPAPPPAPRNAVAERVRERCAEQMAALSACNDERECSAAHIGLTACIAQQVCRDEFRAFEACRGGAAEDAGMRFEAMEGCVRQWGQSQR